jgi:hypothetical protein
MSYPTTVHTSTTSDSWALVCDPSVALRVSLRLAELCPDARYWNWMDSEAIHPDSQQHVPVAMVIVTQGYDSLRRRLLAKLPQRSYDMTMLLETTQPQLVAA